MQNLFGVNGFWCKIDLVKKGGGGCSVLDCGGVFLFAIYLLSFPMVNSIANNRCRFACTCSHTHCSPTHVHLALTHHPCTCNKALLSHNTLLAHSHTLTCNSFMYCYFSRRGLLPSCHILFGKASCFRDVRRPILQTDLSNYF